MIRQNLKYIPVCAIFILALFFVSCAKDDNKNDNDDAVELTVDGINDTEWTYISLTTGKVIGRSAFGSEKDDADWKARTDWDIAICGEYMRTNSGTSGDGIGGIKRMDDKSFDQVLESDAVDLQVDSYKK